MIFRIKARTWIGCREGAAKRGKRRNRVFDRPRYTPRRKKSEPGACRSITGTAGQAGRQARASALRRAGEVARGGGDPDSTRSSWHASRRHSSEQMFLLTGKLSNATLLASLFFFMSRGDFAPACSKNARPLPTLFSSILESQTDSRSNDSL